MGYAIIVWLFACWPASAGLYVNTVSPGNVPWPAGTDGVHKVPYVFDSALSAAQQQTYLNALREYELAANVHFIPRTSETQYILFKYDPNGFDQVSGSNPQIVSVNSLTRAQVCHEMGHSFGLLHEHTRGDQATYVTVLTGNIAPANQHWFTIDPNGVSQGSYDFESVMHFGRNLFSTQPATLDTLQANPGYEKFQPRMGGLALSQGDRAVMKFLYGAGPTLSSVVTNTSESGVGGLRAALDYATDHPGTTITFNIPTTDPGYANGVFTIHPTGHLLPLVTDGTIIDGTTQPGYAGNPLIVLDGSQILPEAEAVPDSIPGMFVYAASCAVKGLSIQRFPWVGMAFLYSDSHNNSVRGCWFGLDYTGAASAPNKYQGIQISNGANFNTIGGTTDHNVLSGNTQYGIWISDATTTGNVVLGNYIGTRADGLAALPNGLGGLIVTGSSHDNTIGGSSAGARNIISGNAAAGVWLIGAGVTGNTVRGNYIGLNANGSAAVPNTTWGVDIRNGPQNNLVADNVISGNSQEGLRIENAGALGNGNMVQGNQVGTAPGGSTAIGNGFAGVTVYGGATGNIIGGTTAAQRNILSGNGTVGLVFGDSGTSGNMAEGNYIGTNANGTASVPNGFAGVYINNGATANYLGNVQPGTANLISGNGGFGVYIADPGTTGNFVLGNLIGTNAGGNAALANAYSGISIFNGAHGNMIGGGVGGGNVISGNENYGVTISDANSNSNLLRGNTIGMNAARTNAIPNAWQGVELQGGVMLNQIGGTGIGDSNLIAGNTLDGVILFDSGTNQNKISQNSIFSNGGNGIALNPGTNANIPAPSLTGALLSPSLVQPDGINVTGSLGASSATTVHVEFFASPPGNNEGQFFIGSTDVTSGNTTFTSIHLTANVPASPPANAYVLTATATDGNGNTSQFSLPHTVTTTDTDGDGIPDNWMMVHFNHTDPRANDKSRATDDADGDGLTNAQEFFAGTDPTNASSTFRITSATLNLGNPQIGFSSVAGKTYRLDFKNDISAGNWSPLVDGIFGTGATLQIVDPGTTGLSKRFYRISLEP